MENEMSDKPSKVCRVRLGETEGSVSSQRTGVTDLPPTAHGGAGLGPNRRKNRPLWQLNKSEAGRA